MKISTDHITNATISFIIFVPTIPKRSSGDRNTRQSWTFRPSSIAFWTYKSWKLPDGFIPMRCCCCFCIFFLLNCKRFRTFWNYLLRSHLFCKTGSSYRFTEMMWQARLKQGFRFYCIHYIKQAGVNWIRIVVSSITGTSWTGEKCCM